MCNLRIHVLLGLALLAAPIAVQAQGTAVVPVAPAAPAAPAAAAPRTLWRFLGIPQTAKALRNGLVNRRGNFPGLERKPPLKPIAAPENLESPNPAIKAAAEIKQAEDMKKQKIKAIKYLASIGCGCYDKDGKITDALLAGTDDCTPDVRLAVIEAIEDNVNKDCCQKCGTTSCCNEKTTKRLSEMAYERDDNGCCLEPSEEIRRAAARVLKKCCPGGPPRGPIEEDFEEYEPLDENELIPVPTPTPEIQPVTPPKPRIPGEPREQNSGVGGEGRDDSQDSPSDSDEPADGDNLILNHSFSGPAIKASLSDSAAAVPVPTRHQQLIPAKIEIQAKPAVHAPVVTTMPQPKNDMDWVRHAVSHPVTSEIQQKKVSFQDVFPQAATQPRKTAFPTLMEFPVTSRSAGTARTPTPIAKPVTASPMVAEVDLVNYQTGEVTLRSRQVQGLRSGVRGDIYGSTDAGVAKIGQLTVRRVGATTVEAVVNDPNTLQQIRIGDRVVCPR